MVPLGCCKDIFSLQCMELVWDPIALKYLEQTIIIMLHIDFGDSMISLRVDRTTVLMW